jgi:hypothetical protein
MNLVGASALPIPLQRRLRILQRLKIILKQKLDGAFARLPACAHAEPGLDFHGIEFT